MDGDLSGWPLDQVVCNKYWDEYWQIINAARKRARPSTKYVENHHVLPQGLGGKRYGEVVCLAYAKHFRAHELLTKFCRGPALVSMNYALNKMTRGRKGKVIVTAQQYAIARKALRDACDDPIERARLSKIASNLMSGKCHRKRLATLAKKQWAERDPDTRKVLIAQRESWRSDPVKVQKYNEKRSVSCRKLWADPEYRAKMLVLLADARRMKPKPRISITDEKSTNILKILQTEPMSFKAICTRLGYTLGPVRMRLTLLRKAGLVKIRRGPNAKWRVSSQENEPYETKRDRKRRVGDERRQKIIEDLLASPFCTPGRREAILSRES